ncbi:MAG: glycosyltransferase [Acidobacteria bacterium]|nr:glycosyltransferase [Acidobacteriota bacterium]
MKMRRHIGIYNRDMNGGGGSEKRSVVMAERLSREHDVTLVVGGPCSLERLEAYYAADLSRVRVARLRLPVQSLLHRNLNSTFGPLLRRAYADLFLQHWSRTLERRYLRQFRAFNFDLLINNQGWSILPCPARAGIYMCMFPHDRKGELRPDASRGLFYAIYAMLGNRIVGMTDSVLDSYSLITANSKYTAEWIRRLWRREAEVVYSACEPMGPPKPKEKIVLHVGRFVGRGRNDDKHQHTLLEVFRRMHGLHSDGWQLHLAGTLLPDANSRKMISQLTAAAEGLPVFIHPNISYNALRDLYRRASIYWHATGFGQSQEEHPGKQEHFGMTTVEAMSAGAVPIVINSGGHRESVSDGYCGFLWNDLAELEHYTSLLAQDPALRANLGERAVQVSEGFGRTAFADRIQDLTDRLLS